MTHIVIIQGHPDAAGGHLCHALAEAYAQGAREAGHELTEITVAKIDFPLLRTQKEFQDGALPETLKPHQDAIGRGRHCVIVYPLWLGTMPALLKAFFEQVFRPGFAFKPGKRFMTPLLKGRSARIVITMGMPTLVYRWYFGAHGLKSLEKSVLGFIGIKPIRQSLFGMVDSASEIRRAKWLARMRDCGRRAA